METLSLSDAVAEAVRFYNEHPDETLIVVTADHETGGLTLSWEKGYNLYFDKLEELRQARTNKLLEGQSLRRREGAHERNLA